MWVKGYLGIEIICLEENFRWKGYSLVSFSLRTKYQSILPVFKNNYYSFPVKGQIICNMFIFGNVIEDKLAHVEN